MMKTADILAYVYAIRDAIPDDYSTRAARYECIDLIQLLQRQIREEAAKASGSGNAHKYVTKMLDELKKGNRPALAYPWTDKAGRQCMCDGYRAYRLMEPLPLPERPADAGDGLDLDKIFPVSVSPLEKMPAPDLAELKAYITTRKAETKGQKPAPVIVWDFGAGKPLVNAQYLLELLTVMKDVRYIWYDPKSPFAPLYAPGANGDAILLPVRREP